MMFAAVVEMVRRETINRNRNAVQTNPTPLSRGTVCSWFLCEC